MQFTSLENETAINKHAGSKEGCSSQHSKTKATINQHARDYKHNGAETRSSNTATENKRKCDIRHAPVTAEKQQVNDQIDELQ